MKNRDTIKFLSKVVIITLLIVFIARQLFFELYTISTTQMGSQFAVGDEVLVCKSYGSRMPITPLSLPFVGDRYYSDLIELPYKRLFTTELSKNDIVAFNSPLEVEKPLDKRSVFLSRCIGLPGDTIMIRNGEYYINNKEYVYAPTKEFLYCTPKDNYNTLLQIVDDIGVEVRNASFSRDSVSFLMDKYDAFLLSKNVDKECFYKKKNLVHETIIFIVPSIGCKVRLTDNNLKIYRSVIESEQGDNAVFNGNKVLINGQEKDIYTFQDNYYWMLSDNLIEAYDSQVLGFIPNKNIIGKANYILYNMSDNGFNTDRFFKRIR